MAPRQSLPRRKRKRPPRDRKITANSRARKARADCRPWPDLPREILDHFLGRISLTDRLRFAAVCKPWRRATRSDDPFPAPPPIPQLPWAVIINPSSNFLTVFSLSEEFRSYNIPKGMKQSKYGEIYGVSVTGLASGWVLLANSCCAPTPHLLNPMSQKLMKLPQVISDRFRTAVITGPADDPNSMIAVRTQTSIHFLRLGNIEWIECASNVRNPRLRSDMLVYCRGVFYGMSYAGDLFDYITMHWLGMDISLLWPEAGEGVCKDYLLESLGEVWLVQVCYNDNVISSPHLWIKDSRKLSLTAVRVFRADLENNAWEEVKSFHDRDLFLSRGGSFALPTEETGSRGNTVHIAAATKLKSGKMWWYHVEVDYETTKIVSFTSRVQTLWIKESNTFWLQPTL